MNELWFLKVNHPKIKIYSPLKLVSDKEISFLDYLSASPSLFLHGWRKDSHPPSIELNNQNYLNWTSNFIRVQSFSNWKVKIMMLFCFIRHNTKHITPYLARLIKICLQSSSSHNSKWSHHTKIFNIDGKFSKFQHTLENRET